MSAFVHLPVLSREAPEALVARPDGLYVDGTFGRGGHSRLILERLAQQGRLIAFDRDPEAVAAAAAIKDPRFQIVHAPFSAMKERLGDLGIRQVDGIFLDIGVSSPQIDDPSRGFSFRFEGPLDMRMDTSCGETAAEWLARASVEEIAEVLADFGDAVLAGRSCKAGAKFVTWEWDFDRQGVHAGHYFMENYEAAKKDFAVRAGLINEQRLFSDEQIAVIKNACEFALEDDATLSYAEEKQLHSVQEQIELLLPQQERNQHPTMEQTM